ncbi:MAG: NAD-dependent epimerase/dehydratase family protein [Candidatus Krumholzibacteriota bacterium]|nr:NAD-dependent epimerase/dehydratase family protein [Candidatus Krumholzibacteriota bacterium]
MKTVLVTGASGFVAGHVARRLKEDGVRIVGTSRSAESVESFDRVYPARLGESLAAVFSGESIDVVVHAANHAGDDEYEINYSGTRRWFEEARTAGVGLQILLSSLSASPSAVSGYGRAKYALEELFTSHDAVAYRLGVVIGNGGMFARIRDSVAAGPLVPLLDGGTSRVFIQGIDFLCDVIQECVTANGEGLRARVWNLQQPSPVTLRVLMDSIRRQYGYRCRFLPVPSLPVLWVLTLAEKLRVRLPVNTTNVRGLREGRTEVFGSDYALFGHREYTLEELIEKTMDGMSPTRSAGGVTQ